MVVLSSPRKHMRSHQPVSRKPLWEMHASCHGENNYLRIYLFFSTMAPGAKRELKFNDKREGGTRRKINILELDPDPAIVTTSSPTPSRTSSRRGAN